MARYVNVSKAFFKRSDFLYTYICIHAQAPSRSVSVSSGFSDSSSVDAQLAKGIKPAIAVGNKGFVPDEVSVSFLLRLG